MNGHFTNDISMYMPYKHMKTYLKFQLSTKWKSEPQKIH